MNPKRSHGRLQPTLAKLWKDSATGAPWEIRAAITGAGAEFKHAWLTTDRQLARLTGALEVECA